MAEFLFWPETIIEALGKGHDPNYCCADSFIFPMLIFLYQIMVVLSCFLTDKVKE